VCKHLPGQCASAGTLKLCSRPGSSCVNAPQIKMYAMLDVQDYYLQAYSRCCICLTISDGLAGIVLGAVSGAVLAAALWILCCHRRGFALGFKKGHPDNNPRAVWPFKRRKASFVPVRSQIQPNVDKLQIASSTASQTNLLGSQPGSHVQSGMSLGLKPSA